jgi:hypothetical protein
MRLPLQEQRYLPHCFLRSKNATALAGAEGFTSLFITKQKLHFYDIESCLLSCLVKQIQL